jgi:hypothetical protein
VISIPPSTSRVFVILAGAGSEASRGSTSCAGRWATSSSSFWWWQSPSSPAAETSSSHAGGRRTVATQLGCNIPPSSSHSRQGRQRGSAGALGSGSLFGFNSWFASLERERERAPSGGRVHPGPWLLLQRSLAGLPMFVAPQARGCSYPWGRNQSSVCNGTLNATVFVHCGCRGLNMCVILARSRVFSLFFSTKTCLLVV